MAISWLGHINVPVGPLKDHFRVTIGADGYENPRGFICRIAATAGTNTLVYQTLEGGDEITLTDVSVDDIIGVGNHPVVLVSISGSSTVTEVEIGLL